MPPESFFDDEAWDDETGEVEAGLGAEPWLLAVLAGAFPRGCEGGLLFAGTAKSFPAVGMFCGFEADGEVGTLFDVARAGGRTAGVAGCTSGSAA